MGKITQNQTGSNTHSTIRSKEPVDIDIDTIDGFRIEAANALRLAKAAAKALAKAKPVSTRKVSCTPKRNGLQQLVAEETSKLKKVCYGSYNCGINTPQEIAWTIPSYTTVHGEKYPAIHLCATCEDSDITCPSDCGCLTRDTESLVDICHSVGGYGLWCDKCVRDHTRVSKNFTDKLGNRYIEYVAK
tara:strand:- start:78 stop:641 length:564 start_codon:yes stop_codon:yes gene_type:complete